MIVLDVIYNEKGGIIIKISSTFRIVRINSLQNVIKNDMPLLGHSLLTSAYFMVGQDHQQSKLAKTIANKDQKLVPIGPPIVLLRPRYRLQIQQSQGMRRQPPVPQTHQLSEAVSYKVMW